MSMIQLKYTEKEFLDKLKTLRSKIELYSFSIKSDVLKVKLDVLSSYNGEELDDFITMLDKEKYTNPEIWLSALISLYNSKLILFLEDKNLTVDNQIYSKVFISHSTKDKVFVGRLARDLKKNDISTWIDDNEILIADSLPEKIENAIINSKYFIIVLSKNSIHSEWVNREIRIAVKEERDVGNVIVIPLIIDDCEIPLLLKNKLYAEFKYPYQYSKSLKKVISLLTGDTHVMSVEPLDILDIHVGDLSVKALIEQNEGSDDTFKDFLRIFYYWFVLV